MLNLRKGAFGNIGMYASGIPAGLLIDSKGPRSAVLIGSVALAIGYFPLRHGSAPLSCLFDDVLTQIAYDRGPGSTNIFLMCLLYFMTGLGGCSAFSASVKTCTFNSITMSAID